VTVNPYCPLPIYGNDHIDMYKGRSRDDTKPHIFAMADEAFRNLIDEGENQSILVTGESGAGKTENTKKVIHYLAAVAAGNSSRARSAARQSANLSEQMLQANPILESFGNAQTVRNNNSSRFGKFIRIEFTPSGQIAGAFIDWYLLEKSRVVKLNRTERNYHIFYQLLSGADQRLRRDLLLEDRGIADFNYTKGGNDIIDGVSDSADWNSLTEAFQIMGFSDNERLSVLRTIAAVLHLGNITVAKETPRADQATLPLEAEVHAKKACALLGIPKDAFVKGLLHPVVKAGREIVEKVQTPEQVRSSLDALAKGIYERGFGELVNQINRKLDRNGVCSDESQFIGVLDIAGFEIFERNSFEQLCINYTNEKLQQFFNHHMFVLEQEEYARERIEWKFIDFGKDLQPTIDLIELSNPIGIFSCLDEDSVMPKATDKSFTEKLHGLWEKKTPKYRPSRLAQGFVLTHYAAEVEYSTDGWLEKNKDPLSDNLTRLLAASTEKHVATLFADCADLEDDVNITRNRIKRGLFRTVAQRHKEQLSSLMNQLHSTRPHFVRCILPNHKKRPKQFQAPLVLDQLRCNGVLEGIRIARTGFPNRLPFAEFRSRYEVLCQNMPKGPLDGQRACQLILEKLDLDRAVYRVGITKVFFRAGVLAELEEQRDALIHGIISRFQSIGRGYVQRRLANKRLYREEATRLIQHNFQVYQQLSRNPWWRLFLRMRPILGATRTANEVKKRDDMIQKLQIKVQADMSERQKLDEERRRTEAEIMRVKKTLDSERALALDKEEIFSRLQKREAELNEKLAGAIEDQERLEDQLDDLLDAKKKAEEQADIFRIQLEQAGTIIARLENEKKDLTSQVQELDERLSEIEHVRNEKNERSEGLIRDNKMLQSQLSLQERKVADMEAKLLKTDQDRDVNFAKTQKELQSAQSELRSLRFENEQIQQQLSSLSAASTGYEDIMRRKESEMAVLRADATQSESQRKSLESERKHLQSRLDEATERIRQVQGDMDAMKSQRSQLEREAAEAKQVLAAKLSEDAQAGNNRKMLERQIEDLKKELYTAEVNLSKERQSRDDVRLLSDHKYAELKEEYDSLNESKIIIEKEMYIQEDRLRRAVEAKTTAEHERKDLQNELIKLRDRFTQAETARIETEAMAERAISRQAGERTSSLRKELEDLHDELKSTQTEKTRVSQELRDLQTEIADADHFRSQNDQHKERIERELVTIKGRLTASENDNRSLLNKIQQKNLDIARTNSRAGDNQRSRLSQLQTEKAKFEDENKKLSKRIDESQIMISSLEKQKEKLSLDMEDLTHEVEREHKASRNAEKTSSTAAVQLTEANRNLESEKQLRNQAQANARKVQSSLDSAYHEIDELRQQMTMIQKVFDPEIGDETPAWETVKPRLPRSLNLAQELDTVRAALKVAQEKAAHTENRASEMRRSHEDELSEMDHRYSSSKRNMLEEMNQNAQNTLYNQRSPTYRRRSSEFKNRSATSTPDRRHLHTSSQDSLRSDRTQDVDSYNKRMDLAAELDQVQNKLQMAEMENRHLRNELGRSTPSGALGDDSPSLRRVYKLEKENSRLHEQLDDSARKCSALERSMRSGELSLRDVQARSHEELFDLLNAQESSRQSLLTTHNATVAELTEAKSQFDRIRQAKASLEVSHRDLQSELQELSMESEQEASTRAQLLQENADLQIRLDTESSKTEDLASSVYLYKTRADDYFGKLEQAEIAVLKASRAEQFAKSQAREAEQTYSTIIAERKDMDAALEDLQKQGQRQEERIEDLSADLDAALQAKKRLQHELEDYRSQRAMDVEDRETSLEQMRKKYQSEFSTLTNELEIERDNLNHARSENSHLREEIEELRCKWDDEVLNSSTWAKEKARLEMTQQDLTNSREEAVKALNESQGRISTLLSQVRELRTSADSISGERDLLVKEKRNLEARLNESNERFEDLKRGESPSMRNAAGMDRQLMELKSQLAEKEDLAEAAIGKMRRAEALAVEMQKDVIAERENNVGLHRDKATLEKNVKDLQGRVVELESKGYSSASQDVRFLNKRIKEVSQFCHFQRHC
jgi:myosin heavy chain 9/10/11/14